MKMSEKEKRYFAILCVLIALGIFMNLLGGKTGLAFGEMFLGMAAGFALRGIAQKHWGSA